MTEKPSPPGYWSTQADGYDLHGLVRNDLYTLDWDDDRSTLEFGVGDVLEDRYDFASQERVTLAVKGNPQLDGHDWTPADFGERSRPADQTSISESACSQAG